MGSKKNIVDDIEIILTQFGKTDDSVLDENWIGYKIDDVRAQLIRAEYKITNVIDQSWLSPLGVVPFYAVNFADDRNINCCECDISKTILPQIVSLESGNGNQDLGLNIMSTCGKKNYHPYALTMWKELPSEHPRNLFNYYFRIGSDLYVNKKVEQLKIFGILRNPEDGVLITSAPVVSGIIATGVVYLVKHAQIVYNSIVYAVNSTFTGVIGVTTFTGSGVVYLSAQTAAFNDTDAYPCTGDMARQIVFEICTKEFGIEVKGLVADRKNDSKDDSTKGQG
jgi:hypothetical protein